MSPSMTAFTAAIQTTQGRKAAGLPPRKRGVAKKYDPKKASFGTKEFEIVVQLIKGELTQEEAEQLLFNAMHPREPDMRTIRRFIEDVRPHANVYVEFPGFFSHLEENKSPDE